RWRAAKNNDRKGTLTDNPYLPVSGVCRTSLRQDEREPLSLTLVQRDNTTIGPVMQAKSAEL
ncbi:MAG: hypothetical protein ACREJO_06900, partial [Phycisphaerales bacterium]